MDRLHTLAFTHNKLELDEIGKFHIGDDVLKDRLAFLKKQLNLTEIMYLSTCNRVELIFCVDTIVDHDFLVLFFKAFNPAWGNAQVDKAISMAEIFSAEN